MEEEKLNTENNENNHEQEQLNNTNTSETKDKSKSSSKSSLRDAASNVAGAVSENKYKSRKQPLSSSNNNNIPVSNRSNSVGGGLKSQLANRALNKVSNLHPALKALNVLNNVKNAIGNRNVGSVGNTGISGASTESQESDNGTLDSGSSGATSSNSDINSSDDTSEKKSSNPLGSLFSNDLSGKFSFFGKIPKQLKLALALGSTFSGLLTILIPFILILSFFNSLFGADTALASSGGVGNINYGDYELVSDGDEILNESLDTFLVSRGTNLTEFNELIASNVEDSGYGTRAGVVASAVTLIAELGNNYNVKIPYFWGGGHGTISEGAEANWGSGRCYTYANGHAYTSCGLDCSGFVTWAIYNGGYNISPLTTGSFQNLPGAERVELKDSAVLEPGDLLESSSHIALVIAVEEYGYICAEASGRTTGVLFTSRPFTRSGYWGVNMDGFYDTQARS